MPRWGVQTTLCCWTRYFNKSHLWWPGLCVFLPLVLVNLCCPVCGKGGVASLQLISHFWEALTLPARLQEYPLKFCLSVGFSQRKTGLMKPSLKHIRFEAERLSSLCIFRDWGYFCGSWLHSVIHAAPLRARFLFLEKPPLADCGEGNTQEELSAVSCFSKHWL